MSTVGGERGHANATAGGMATSTALRTMGDVLASWHF